MTMPPKREPMATPIGAIVDVRTTLLKKLVYSQPSFSARTNPICPFSERMYPTWIEEAKARRIEKGIRYIWLTLYLGFIITTFLDTAVESVVTDSMSAFSGLTLCF